MKCCHVNNAAELSLNMHERLTQKRIIEIYAAAMDINLPLFNQCPCSKESLKLFRCEFISFEARLSVAMWCCLSCHAAGATRRFSCCVSFAAKFFVHCWCIKNKSISSIIKEWQEIVWPRPLLSSVLLYYSTSFALLTVGKLGRNHHSLTRERAKWWASKGAFFLSWLWSSAVRW